MIEMIILGIFSGVGFIAYKSKWLDYVANQILEAEQRSMND